jgi:hypothetical protein
MFLASPPEAVAPMHRNLARGLALLACAAVVSGGAVTAVHATDDRSARRVAYSGGPPPQVLAYWRDTRIALSPLLLYVRILPESIKAIDGAGGHANAAQVRQAGVMAESFATARDLVGRLAVPAQAPAGTGELLQVACQLYRQSALALTELRGADSAAGAGSAIVRRAALLQTVGDRLIDQVRRVLAIDSVGQRQAPMEFRYAPPVPSVAEVTGSSAVAAPAAPLGSYLSAARAVLAADPNAHSAKQARAVLSTALAGLAADVNAGSEDVIGARLAIVLGLVAQSARLDQHAGSAAALYTLSQDVWNAGRTLTPVPHAQIEPIQLSAAARLRVWTGGAFHGRPPALKSGEDVGAGLPGGLPAIDPSQILKD